tara:strand:- start:665 stop:1381 length:717 start_codon:yes stop_codon:yes gene_type:complete
MNNSIVYTYKKPQYKILSRESNQRGWIIKSIESARLLGYCIELYTNDDQFSKGLDIDLVHFIDDEYELWDSFKIYVLEHRLDNNYFLCDNDVIFKKQIPFDNSIDLYFDGTELHNWDWAYSDTMKYLKDSNIFDNISFWKYDKMPVLNVGILKINNSKLKEDYIFYWKQLYTLILPKIDNVNKTFITAIITQYLLTLLSKNYTTDHFTLDANWPYGNNFYNHFVGSFKWKNSSIKTII